MNEHVEAVQRMQDYIAEHLNEEITLTALAGVSCFSPWYARRIFLQFTGLSPADYIRRLRLRNSALRLRDEHTRIIDAALDTGFGSVDGYQRAFYREFGVNPKSYAQNPVPIPLFTPYGVKSKYAERNIPPMSETKTVFIQVIQKPARKVILKRGKRATHYFEYCNEVGCDVWGILTSIKSISGEPVCLWLPDALIPAGTSQYVQGVEVPTDYSGEIPQGFDVISLPASEYLLFKGEPFREEDYESAILQIWDAEKKYDPSVIGYRWNDQMPRIQLEPIGNRGYMELMPIRKI